MGSDTINDRLFKASASTFQWTRWLTKWKHACIRVCTLFPSLSVWRIHSVKETPTRRFSLFPFQMVILFHDRKAKPLYDWLFLKRQGSIQVSSFKPLVASRHQYRHMVMVINTTANRNPNRSPCLQVLLITAHTTYYYYYYQLRSKRQLRQVLLSSTDQSLNRYRKKPRQQRHPTPQFQTEKANERPHATPPRSRSRKAKWDHTRPGTNDRDPSKWGHMTQLHDRDPESKSESPNRLERDRAKEPNTYCRNTLLHSSDTLRMVRTRVKSICDH